MLGSSPSNSMTASPIRSKSFSLMLSATTDTNGSVGPSSSEAGAPSSRPARKRSSSGVKGPSVAAGAVVADRGCRRVRGRGLGRGRSPGAWSWRRGCRRRNNGHAHGWLDGHDLHLGALVVGEQRLLREGCGSADARELAAVDGDAPALGLLALRKAARHGITHDLLQVLGARRAP